LAERGLCGATFSPILAGFEDTRVVNGLTVHSACTRLAVTCVGCHAIHAKTAVLARIVGAVIDVFFTEFTGIALEAITLKTGWST
tara:strand:+ start:253 stop:507 length:255 start_codon:yes stop_codon:yes gene_type:complete